jgi:hypothetical protein
MKVKTVELIGTALDWAVAMSLGYIPAKREKRNWGYATVPAPELAFSRLLTSKDNPGNSLYQRNLGFSNDWSQGGPIIERERIHLDEGHGLWGALHSYEYSSFGHTPLIASMRCYVASKLGDEVEIPEELLK